MWRGVGTACCAGAFWAKSPPGRRCLACVDGAGREFIDLLSAMVALGAFWSVLAEVVALAEEASNLSDEQLRAALMALDHATRRLMGGEAVNC